jgi:arylformamidase
VLDILVRDYDFFLEIKHIKLTMIIDLTHTLENDISAYPGTMIPEFKQLNAIPEDGYAELSMTMCTHTGTHIDAPAHIIPGAKYLDDFSVDTFIGKAMVIDCSERKSIDLELLKSFEDKIAQTDFILFYAGWQEKWCTQSYFDEFPVLTQESIQWLIKYKIKGVGFDTISADSIGATQLTNHNLLLSKEILIIENLTNLDKLFEKSFEFNCIPLKIYRSDGSPVRAFAKI